MTKQEFEDELRQDAYIEEREAAEHDNNLHDIDYFTEHFGHKFEEASEIIRELAELHEKYGHTLLPEDLW